MYSKQAGRYRDTEVLSASPAQLVVMVFDHLLVNLQRGRMAAERGDVEQRCVALTRARQAVGELLVTLDRDAGGDLAGRLAGVYGFLLSELGTIRSDEDLPKLIAMISMVTELRDAFATISTKVGLGGVAA